MTIRRVELSAPQESVMGEAIRKFHSRKNDIGTFVKVKGHPYHGNEHTLIIIGDESYLSLWLALFAKHYPKTRMEIIAVKKKLTETVNEVIKLKEIERRAINGKMKRWYKVDRGIDYFRRHGDSRIEGPDIAKIPDDYLKVVCPNIKLDFLISIKHNGLAKKRITDVREILRHICH